MHSKLTVILSQHIEEMLPLSLSPNTVFKHELIINHCSFIIELFFFTGNF